MGVPQLDSCCCGCSLSTGSKIIGWLYLVGSVISLLTMWGVMIFLKAIEDDPEHHKEIQRYIPMLRIMFWILIVIFVVSLVFAIILLKGVYEKKPQYLRLWVIANLVIIVLQYGIKLVVMLSFSGFINPFEFVGILLTLYYILVVYSYYRVMLQDPTQC